MFRIKSGNCSKGDKFLLHGHMVTVKSVYDGVITVVDRNGREYRVKKDESVFNSYCEDAIKSEKERIAEREEKIKELRQLQSNLKSKIKKLNADMVTLLAKVNGKKENLSGSQQTDFLKMQRKYNLANSDLVSASNQEYSSLMDNFCSWLDVGKLENQNAFNQAMLRDLA